MKPAALMLNVAAQASALLISGVLVPNSPWRAVVTVQACPKPAAGSTAPRPRTVRGVASAAGRMRARYLWAQLLAPIYGVCERKCSRCGGQGASQSRRWSGKYWNR